MPSSTASLAMVAIGSLLNLRPAFAALDLFWVANSLAAALMSSIVLGQILLPRITNGATGRPLVQRARIFEAAGDMATESSATLPDRPRQIANPREVPSRSPGRASAGVPAPPRAGRSTRRLVRAAPGGRATAP